MQILSEKTVEIMGYSPTIHRIILLLGFLTIISALTLIIIIRNYDDCTASDIILIISFLIVIFCGSATILLSGLGETPQAQYQEYKVIFTDEVDMDEFSEKYEIVSKEGELYTIRDKETIPIQK